MSDEIDALNDYVYSHARQDIEDGIDVHFFRVVTWDVDPAEFRKLFEATLSDFGGHGEFGDLSLERVKKGPGYIELGGHVGDQGMALLLMGLGEAAGCWKVVTPLTLGLTGEAADSLAGGGMVMITGYTDAAS